MSSTFTTPAWVNQSDPATIGDFYRMNHEALTNPKHPLHAIVSSELRALSVQRVRQLGGDPYQPHFGDGIVG